MFFSRRRPYGTQDDRAFAHFVAGFHAHKNKDFATAAAEYDRAIAIDPAYDKAINHRGLLFMREANVRFVVRRRPETRLYAEAEAAFTRARRLNPKVPEYSYNLATVLSYRGMLAANGAAYGLTSDRQHAIDLQTSSIETYQETVNLIDQIISQTFPWFVHRIRRIIRPKRYRILEGRRAELLSLRAKVLLSEACSRAWRRQLAGAWAPEHVEVENRCIDAAQKLRRDNKELLRNAEVDLDYNLACYRAINEEVEEACNLFIQLRAIEPVVYDEAAADPDLIHIRPLSRLFEC